MPDDERKGRRLGDETKGRIADLASGWTMDGDAPPVPEPPIKRDASGPTRDAPRRKAKTPPPPPPGSSARKALEDKTAPLREAGGGPDEASRRPSPPPAGRPPPPPRPRTGAAPLAGKRAAREPLDLSSLPEAERTKENRGAIGIKHDRNASLTANAASGTIGGDTPPPIFDRAAIAAGQRGALASDRVMPGARPDASPGIGGVTPTARLGSPSPGAAGPLRTPARGVAARSSPAEAGEGALARGTPDLGTIDPTGEDPRPAGRAVGGPTPRDTASPIADRLPRSPAAPARGEPASPPTAPILGDDSIEEIVLEAGRIAVPVGEFDHGQTALEQDKLRIAHAQATIKRDPAGARLGLAEPAPAAKPPSAEVGFDDPTSVGPRSTGSVFDEPTRRIDGAALGDASGTSTGRFERGDPTAGERGDPTVGERPDATAISTPASGHAPTGTLRSSAALPRQPGIAGDLRYVATVVLGLREARRELAAITARQATRQQSRRHHLVTLGRAAVTADGFDHPALAASREKLSSVEDERSQHAGHVIAADAELARVGRDREARARQYAADVAALDAELAGLAKKLEPLEKEAAATRKRGTDLHEALRRIDAKIAATEASLDSAKGGKLDRAQIQAEIATLRADRKAIQADEPGIAGQLDALNPRIAALEAARAEAQRKRVELEAAERDDQRRVEELLAAIGAKRKVVDRAAADAEALRDKILFQLGERLYVDRPGDLTAELAPIDEIDLELGEADRRMMELREIVGSVDRWKLARGIALIVAIVAAAGALAGWLIFYRP